MEHRGETPGQETDLGARFRAGDMGAFRCVYDAHVGRVHALALRMTADPERAEDLTQEVFLRAWSKRHTLRNGDAFTAWITRAAVNLIVSRNRHHLRRSSREVAMPECREAPDRAPVRDLAEAVDLEHAIGRLPPSAREVFVLHDVEGFTHEEIDRMAGIAPGTPKAHLRRARMLLRREMER